MLPRKMARGKHGGSVGALVDTPNPAGLPCEDRRHHPPNPAARMAADSTPEEEVRRLERHYSVNPEGLVFARLADAYRRCGRRERALELLREGLERHPDYATGHLIQARTLREEGRPADAARSFRRVLELDAENLVALRSLAELAAERGDMEEARRWADRLERADPFASFSPGRVASGEGDAEGGDDGEERGPVSDGVEETRGPPADADPSDPRGDEAAPVSAPPVPDDPDEIPGEDGLASEIAAMADDGWWGDSRGEGGNPADDGEVATETMAHLYAQQGLYEEAAEVYRRLLDRRPGDGDLRSRLEEMERRAAGDGEPAPAEGNRPDGTSADAGEDGTGGASPSPGGASSAREHFRNLLRGRARDGGDRSSGTGGIPAKDAGSGTTERARAPAEETAG